MAGGPGGDGGAEKVDGHGVLGGEGGGDGEVGDVDDWLREGGGDGDGGGFVLAVHGGNLRVNLIWNGVREEGAVTKKERWLTDYLSVEPCITTVLKCG